jgi:hypothetical protein
MIPNNGLLQAPMSLQADLANLQHRIELSAYGGYPSPVCARYYSATQKSQPTKSNDTVAVTYFTVSHRDAVAKSWFRDVTDTKF